MKHPVLAMVLISTVAYGAWKWRGGGAEAAHDEALVVDRIWIDHLPKDDRDTVNVFVALDDDAVGVFQASSSWRGAFEIFRFEQHGDELRIHYPQTGGRETVRTSAHRCNEGQMDFCLDLGGSSRGVKRYYSRKGWEIQGRDPAAASRRVNEVVDGLVPRD